MCKVFQAYASYCNFHNYIFLPSVPSTRISRTAENIRGIVIAPDLELALRAIELSVHENSEKVRSGFPKKSLYRHVTKKRHDKKSLDLVQKRHLKPSSFEKHNLSKFALHTLSPLEAENKVYVWLQ